MDKAWERNDEGHREVASILQSPADWIASPQTEENPAIPPAPEENPPAISPAEENITPENQEQTKENEKSTPEITIDEPKGDPEMVPVYVKSLLPLFCKTYQSTMITSVKKSSLNLIKKMIYYLNSDLLKEVCSENQIIVGEFRSLSILSVLFFLSILPISSILSI